MKTTDKCLNCSYFTLLANAPKGVGQCRRYPPQVQVLQMAAPVASQIQLGGRAPSQLQTLSNFPPTSEDGWCGEWRVAGTKLAMN